MKKIRNKKTLILGFISLFIVVSVIAISTFTDGNLISVYNSFEQPSLSHFLERIIWAETFFKNNSWI